MRCENLLIIQYYYVEDIKHRADFPKMKSYSSLCWQRVKGIKRVVKNDFLILLRRSTFYKIIIKKDIRGKTDLCDKKEATSTSRTFIMSFIHDKVSSATLNFMLPDAARVTIEIWGHNRQTKMNERQNCLVVGSRWTLVSHVTSMQMHATPFSVLSMPDSRLFTLMRMRMPLSIRKAWLHDDNSRWHLRRTYLSMNCVKRT